jgi:hypothetical protein
MNLRVSKCGSESAHSLPEAIIAALLVGTMLISLYAGFSTGFSLVRSSQEELRATQIILERMEGIRLCTWTQLQDTNRYLRPTFTEYFNPSGQTNQSTGLIYTGQVTTNRPTAIPASVFYRTNMLQVTVKVYWTNRFAGQEILRSKQMQTYVSRYGMQNY